MTVNFTVSKKQRMGLMMKAVNPASAEDALKKTRMPIYFSKKLSPVKQVRVLCVGVVCGVCWVMYVVHSHRSDLT